MSSTGQIVGGIVGAVVGFLVTWNPYGALQGAAIGASIGGYLDPPKGPEQQGPRLSDLAVQTSTYGAFIPRVYGTVAVYGNVFWMENNQLREVARKEESGSKGGGSTTTVETFEYFATLAIGLCEGPILGIRRVWAGPDLIYDAGSGTLESIIASNQASSENFTLYYGTIDQMPDSRIQADLGVDNTSAHRGLAYLVIRDFAVKKYGNAIPAFKVEVIKPDQWGVNTVLDVEPYAETPMTWESGAAFRDDFTGLYYLSAREVGSADVSNLSIGRSGVGTEYIVETNLDNEKVRGIVSYDGEMWLGNQLNDIFSTNKYRRTSDLYFFEIYSDTLVRGIREKAGLDDGYMFLYTAGGAGTSGTYTKVGYTVVEATGGILVTGRDATSGYRLNTCGDQLHEFSVSTNSVTVKLYTDSFVFTEQFTVVVPGDALSNVNTAFSAQGIGVQSCMRGGKFYLCQEVSGGYRVVILNASGVVDDFVVSATSGMAALYGFYMASEFAGYIVNGDTVIQFSHYPQGEQPISEIIAAECALTGILEPSDIDVTTLTQSVTGYRVASIGSIRKSIEPLQAVFPFDVIQSGYQVLFKPRGSSSVATIEEGELSIDERLRQSREMDTQLPRRIVAKYLDIERNYDTNEQSWQRPGVESVNTRTMELPIVLSANKAARTVESLGYLYWLERADFGPFTLPPTYSALEPADIITLTMSYADYELRLTTVNYQADGTVTCTGKLNNAAVYESFAESVEVPDDTVVPLAGASEYILADIPVIDDTLQNRPGYVAVMTGITTGWPGGVVFSSVDTGQTWQVVQGFVGKCTFGTVRGTLAANSGAMIQRSSGMIVDLYSGTLSSITEDQMLTGRNYAAYGVDGRWEIIRFRDATLNADGSYTLTNFVRGDKGTEWATGLHVAGDSFIFLDDPDGAFVGMPAALIGVDINYRGVTSGASIDSDTDLAFAYQGVNLEPLSAVNAQALRDGSSNLTATFSRRSRLSSSWWTNGVQAVVGETTEAYEIDVMNGSAVERTISVSSPAFSYSAADQTTDFGSPQASIVFRIYQLSETVGRGFVYEVTL